MIIFFVEEIIQYLLFRHNFFHQIITMSLKLFTFAAKSCGSSCSFEKYP